MSSKLFEYINLHNGEEAHAKVLENIKASISFRGSNLWILACAIVIACVGLNVNSTAVIIGAMLISPLMGPIVGAGFALAIFDINLLKRSGKNLLIATIVSLSVALLYFYITPFKETQSELLARTAPNIYDVLIAFFGGLVGVIALTRVEKGNPIPGVAIATALMPPLCTAGYGLANGNLNYFLGAFFLYIINCVFICISTFFIIKYLKYEPVKAINSSTNKKLKYGITTLILIIIVPSLLLAYNLLEEKKFNQKVEQFINNEFTSNGYVVIFKQIKFNAKPKSIELAFLERNLTNDELVILNNKLINYDISNTNLIIRKEFGDLKGKIIKEMSGSSKALFERDSIIKDLEKELSEYKVNYSDVLKEFEILFPEFSHVSIGKQVVSLFNDSISTQLTVLYQTKSERAHIDEKKIKMWLEQKFNTTDVVIVHQK
jgi:uncharacterized hydrophobic protein (TIGR00271 family)